MAKQIVFPFTDTPIEGVTTNTTNVGLINFKDDWRAERYTSGELVLTNLRAPIGYPEKFRYHFSTPNTLYKGSGIEPSVRSQTNKVVTLLVQHECVVSVVDPADPTLLIDVPCKTNFVLKMPMISEMTGSICLTLFQRNLAGIFETGSNSANRLNALLRGSLLPADILQ